MRARTTARSVAIGAVIAALGVLASAVFAFAKEGGIVTLAAPILRDADPGSSVTVEFAVTGLGDEDSRPATGWPIVLRLTAPDGSFTEALGAERGSSGTYVATIEVPAGGITTADFAVRGVSTFADGSTERSDLPLAVDGLLFTTAAHRAPAPAALDAAQPAAAAPAPDYRPAVIGGALALTLVIAVVAFVSGRRRALHSA